MATKEERDRLYALTDFYEKANTYQAEHLREAFRYGWDEASRDGLDSPAGHHHSRAYVVAFGRGWNAYRRWQAQS